jgi:hypothetical protein
MDWDLFKDHLEANLKPLRDDITEIKSDVKASNKDISELKEFFGS